MQLGMLGGGQLARMLALAGQPLGVNVICLEPVTDACAAPVSEHLIGDYDDPALLQMLAKKLDVVTYEFENVPAACVEILAENGTSVFPPAAALSASQDRLVEKNLFRDLNIPTPGFVAVDSLDDLQNAATELGLPAVLKTRRFGYDGKGQFVLKTPEDITTAWDELGGVPLILESFIPFEREISVIAVRNSDADCMFYPISENSHRDGILRVSISRSGDAIQGMAEEFVQRLLDKLDYVGVVALELFQIGENLVANEFAPRVHNSGHWTIEGAETSQFENHVRAVIGLPLGSTAAVGSAAMVNFIGSMPAADDVLALEKVHLHDYGKSARKARKVGHATIRTDDPDELESLLKPLLALAEAAEIQD